MSDTQFYSVLDAFDELFAVCPPRSCAQKRYYRAVPDGEIVTPLDNGEPVYHHPLSAIAVFYKGPTDTLGVRYSVVMSGQRRRYYDRDYSLDHGADAFRVAIQYARDCGHGDLIESNNVTLGALPNSSDYVLTIGGSKMHLAR
jgi:hypothetical protein